MNIIERWKETEEAKALNVTSINFTPFEKQGISTNRGYTYGEVGMIQISTKQVVVAFNHDDFHGGCGVGIISRYSVRNVNWSPADETTREHTKSVIDSILRFICESKKVYSESRGALFAVNAPITNNPNHFLLIAGFVPIAEFGNPVHENHKLFIWMKQFTEVRGGIPNNFSDEVSKNVVGSGKSYIHFLKEDVESKKTVKKDVTNRK